MNILTCWQGLHEEAMSFMDVASKTTSKENIDWLGHFSFHFIQ